MKTNFLFLIILIFLSACTNSTPTTKPTSQAGVIPSKSSKVSCCKAPTKSALKDLPSESIYTLQDSFTTQNNKSIKLSSLRDKPTLIGMIFSNCTYACPRLTADMNSIYKKMGGKRNDVNYVLVSFDTERDTPERLKVFAKEMGLDKHWTLLRASEQSVRTLSVLLNVQYEKDLEGNFSHSNLISVLNRDGVLKFQKEGLEANHTETISLLNKLTE